MPRTPVAIPSLQTTNAGPRITLRASEFDARWNALGVHTDQDRAAAMGVPKSTYSLTKSGQRDPGTDFMARACTALGVGLDDLFTITGLEP